MKQAEDRDGSPRSADRLSRRSVLQSTVLTGIGGAALSGTAAATEDESEAEFASDDVIVEDYWVEVDSDTDESGENDRVHVEIARPASTDDDVELPVIMEPSPYFGGLLDPEDRRGPYTMEYELYRPEDSDTQDAPQKAEPPIEGNAEVLGTDESELAEFTGSDDPSRIGPNDYEQAFLEEGYVFAYAAALGSEQSTGCPTTGDDREIDGIRAVVDWFNGRATAYDAKVGGDEQTADWTDGNTGMIGVSYNGTIPNGVAATGVDGLQTIVPIVAISSWYDYYRSNGAVIAPGARGWASVGVDTDYMASGVLTREDPDACEPVLDSLTANQDRVTGDYSGFWAERDYVPDADQVEASVLVTHGLDDYNVKIRQARQWLDALKEADVPYHVWFHQSDHDDPVRLHPGPWLEFLGDWWDYWLKGEDNGVMDGPNATIQRREETGDPEDWPLETYEDYPDPDATGAEVEMTPEGSEHGGIVLDDPVADDESFVDDSEVAPLQLVDQEESGNRLLYTTGELEEAVRLSGRVELDLTVSADDEIGLLAAAVVDFDEDGEPYDVNRGWMNLQNRNAVDETDPIEPGESYEIEHFVQSIDHVFETGHRIGLAIYSSDFNFSQRPPSEPEFTLSLLESSATLPVVGGEATLRDALPGASFDCAAYREELAGNGVITTSNLRTAVNDWRAGSLPNDCFATLIDEWSAGD